MSVAATISPVLLFGTPAAAMPIPLMVLPFFCAFSRICFASSTKRFFMLSPPFDASVGIEPYSCTDGITQPAASAIFLLHAGSGNVTNP